MAKNKVFMLLDRSGSMESMWKEALGGINGYVSALPADTEILLATFDSVGYDIVRSTTAKEWRPLTNEDAYPRGTTPLYDSAARMLQSMIDSGSKRAIFVLITDGYENCSMKYRDWEVKALFEQATKKLDYEAVFLGANFDKIGEVAKQAFNMNDSSRFMYTNARGMGASMNATAVATQAYFTAGKTECFFNEADKLRATGVSVNTVATSTN